MAMDTDLALKTAADSACISMGATLVRITDFCHSLNAEAARKGAVVAVPVYAATASAFNASTANYAQTTDVGGAEVTLNKHYVAGFQATDVELSGSDLKFFEDGGKAAGIALAKKMRDEFFGLVTATSVTTHYASVAKTKAGFAGLYQTAVDSDIAPENAVLVLKPEYYAALLGTVADASVIGSDAFATGRFTNGVVGFSSVVCAPTLAENVVGFIAEKGALAFGGRAIENYLPGAYQSFVKAQDEATGAGLSMLSFVKQETGVYHVSATNLFGCAILNEPHVVRLVAAG